MAAWSRLSRFSSGDAYQEVPLQFAPGAFHIDLRVGRKLRAEPLNTTLNPRACPILEGAVAAILDPMLVGEIPITRNIKRRPLLR
jgi:hypothetical protein